MEISTIIWSAVVAVVALIAIANIVKHFNPRKGSTHKGERILTLGREEDELYLPGDPDDNIAI